MDGNMSDMGSEDNMTMIPVAQGELGQNYDDDVMARRLKNRERQRRYRARKRLESGSKREHNKDDSAPPQSQVLVNWGINGGDSRIFCPRNWKQDARRAHMAKEQQSITNDPGNVGRSVTEDGSERKVVPGRRHWKADARNKKD